MSKALIHVFQAIKEHHLEQLKAAIKNDQSLVNLKDDKGNTALIIAAEYGTTAIIDYLLKHGAHINYQVPPHHYTPLIIAVRSQQKDIIKYLLESGADTDKLDNQGNNALWHAEQQGEQSVINLLKKD